MSAEFRIVIVDETGATFGRGSAAAMARPDIGEMQQTAERAARSASAPEANTQPGMTQQPAATSGGAPSQTTASGTPAPAPSPHGSHQAAGSGSNQPVQEGSSSQPSASEPRQRSPKSRQGASHGEPVEQQEPTTLLGRMRSMLGGAVQKGMSVASGAVEAMHGGKEMIMGAAEGNLKEVHQGFGTVLTAVNHLMGMFGGQGHGGGGPRNLVQASGGGGHEQAPATTGSVKEAVASAMQAGARTTPAMLDRSDSGERDENRTMRDRVSDFSYNVGKRLGKFAAKAVKYGKNLKAIRGLVMQRGKAYAGKIGNKLIGKKAMGFMSRGVKALAPGGGMMGTAAVAARALGVVIGGLTAGVVLAVGAIAAITAGFNKLGSVLEKNAEEWAGYSPEVSAAFGKRAAQHEQHQMHRASRFGERAANVIDFGTRWEKMMSEYYDEFLNIMYTAWEWLQPWGEAVLWGLNMFMRWWKGEKEEEKHEEEDPFFAGMMGHGELAFQLPAGWAGGNH